MEILRQCAGTDRRHLRRGRRRRADRRHRRLRQARCGRRSRIIGVQPVDSDAMTRSLEAGRRVDAAARRAVRRRRRGQAGRQGDVPPRARRRRRDRPRRHRRDLRGDQGRLRGHALDPRAGRRARDRRGEGLCRAARRSKDQTLVAIACGANMNFDRLRFVAERAEVGEQREAVLAVTIPERPGSFRRSAGCSASATSPSSTTAIADPVEAHVFVGVEVARPRRDGRARSRDLAAPRHRDARPVRQRDGEAARPPPGRRPRAAGAATSCSTASSFPSGRAR